MRPTFVSCLVFLAAAGCAASAPPAPDLAVHLRTWSDRSFDAKWLVAQSPATSESVQGEPHLATAAFDPADGLDRSEAERLASITNGRVREARAAAGITAATAKHAGRLDDPSLDLDAERILGSVPEPWILGASLGFEIPISGRLSIEKSRTAAEHAVSLARIQRVTWEERIALRAEWIHWITALERAGAATTFLQRLDEVVELADRLSNAGAIQRTDARLFKIERATREAERIALEGESRRFELRIRARIGLAPTAEVTLTPTALPPELTAESGLDRLIATNLRVDEARAERVAAVEEFREQTARQLPDLSLAPGAGTEDGETRIGLGLSIPLPLWNRNRAAIAAAEARVAAAEAHLLATLEEEVQFLAIAKADLSVASARRALIETDVLPKIAEQVAELRRLADLGELSTLSLLTSLERELNGRLAWIDAREAELLAANAITERIGPPKEERSGSVLEGPTP